MNRTACKLLHGAVFDHPTKETAGRTKLQSILKNSQDSLILKGAVIDEDAVCIAAPWEFPVLQIWGKICLKYKNMTDMLTGTMREQLVNMITCVTGDVRQRRTIYEENQDFEAGT